MSKASTVREWREKIATDDKWAQRALLVIHSKQTESEKASKTTQDRNGVGFGAFHAEAMTSIAETLITMNSLSKKQAMYVRRVMKSYAGQLYRITHEGA